MYNFDNDKYKKKVEDSWIGKLLLLGILIVIIGLKFIYDRFFK
jgi:hypothetical protein